MKNATVLAMIVAVIALVLLYINQKKKNAEEKIKSIFSNVRNIREKLLGDTCVGTCMKSSSMVTAASRSNMSVPAYCSLQCRKAQCMHCMQDQTVKKSSADMDVAVDDFCNMLENCGNDERRGCLTSCLTDDTTEAAAADGGLTTGAYCTNFCEKFPKERVEVVSRQRCLISCAVNPQTAELAEREGMSPLEFCSQKCP